MQLDELTDQIIVGRSLRGGAPGAASVPVVNLRDVGNVLAPVEILDAVEASDAERERLALASGDVVVTARGANVRAAVADETHHGVLLGANLIAIRLSGSVSPHLLAAYLRHPMTVATLTADFAGTTTAGFTVESLKRLPIHDRPARQADFADFVRYVDLYAVRQAQALQFYRRAAEEVAFQCLAPYGPGSPA